ncbi:hypothetical protein AAY473_007900 [Plecturocebus cupreus]
MSCCHPVTVTQLTTLSS